MPPGWPSRANYELNITTLKLLENQVQYEPLRRVSYAIDTYSLEYSGTTPQPALTNNLGVGAAPPDQGFVHSAATAPFLTLRARLAESGVLTRIVVQPTISLSWKGRECRPNVEASGRP
jgi:hypothetical protein